MGQKKQARQWVVIFSGGLILIVLLAVLGIRLRYGGGKTDFPDRTTMPVFSADSLETVAHLSHPPGNLAVSEDGRIFFSLHPEGRPYIKSGSPRRAVWKPF